MPVTLFLCGDVMLGRGIDQILPHPGNPRLFERYAGSALDYLQLAEHACGPIPRPVDFAYVWGDALAALRRLGPDLRVINLETAVTTSDAAWPGRGIHYRMHPDNVPCLTAAGIDCCVLANNHVLDWGRAGLEQTLTALHGAGIRTAGAGHDATQAGAAAVLELTGGVRVRVYAFATDSSGVPRNWQAGDGRAGVNRLEDLSAASLESIGRQLAQEHRTGDLVVVSIHWGGNWGYEISSAEREFAHGLIESAGAHIVHGHSSHHPRGIEVYHGQPIFYGCGDLLNDYEGISGYESFRPDLGLMYLPTLDAASGKLQRLTLVPTRIHGLRIRQAAPEAAAWLAKRMDRECRPLGAGILQTSDDRLALTWR